MAHKLEFALWIALVTTPLLALAQDAEQVVRGRIGNQAYAFRMLPPASFPQLPVPVISDLEKRHCMIPQTYEARTPENVIHGSFHEKGSSDWAALCSQNGTSMLLIYWSGSASKPAELAAQLNADNANPHNESSDLGYARGIDTATPTDMNEVISNRASGPFDHDGIRDAHIEKSSIIHYFKNDKWMTLSGIE